MTLHVLTHLIDTRIPADLPTYVCQMTHHSALVADLDFATQALIASLADSIDEIGIVPIAAGSLILLDRIAVMVVALAAAP